ncbi:hypothetical protein EGW08_012825 [Elysia chlorotica]|uniref:Major facilitator superfamily (MFS) profile domain-containing protein n=1 Tax=Elysia chlorotica TaxID=188477 RepID=A0A3S1HHE9_ELYCH|nr:hypothetical protein EGW08_012825 [Elysia chlorotica]
MASGCDETKPLLDKKSSSSFRGHGGSMSGWHQTYSPDQQKPNLLPFGEEMHPRDGSRTRQNRDGEEDEESNDPDPPITAVGHSVTESVRAKVALVAVTVCYFLGYTPAMVIMNPLLYDRMAEDGDHQFNTSSQMPCVANHSHSALNASWIEAQDALERRVSTLELFLHLTTYLPAVLPILALGPITDTYGRKVGFLLPIAGTLIKQIVYIVVVARRLPLSLLYVAHIIEACGGSFAAMLSVVFSVVSDVTRVGQGRSGWVAAMEALQTLAAAAAQIYTAQWMRHGYVPPLVCALCMCCVAFTLATFLLPETRACATGRSGQASSDEQSNGMWRTTLSTCWNTVKESAAVYCKDDASDQENPRQTRILSKRRLCLAIFTLVVAVNFSRTGVEALFQLKYPLCWAATEVYQFNGFRIFLSWVAILVTLAVTQRIFKMADRYVAIVGVVSSILSNAALSLADNDVMVYEAAVVGYMTRSTIPMLRSVLSSIVGHAHQGAVYAGLGCIESLGASVFSTAANRIYYASLSYWAGQVFLVFACIMVIALALLVVLNVLFIRERNRMVIDPSQMSIQDDPIAADSIECPR